MASSPSSTDLSSLGLRQWSAAVLLISFIIASREYINFFLPQRLCQTNGWRRYYVFGLNILVTIISIIKQENNEWRIVKKLPARTLYKVNPLWAQENCRDHYTAIDWYTGR